MYDLTTLDSNLAAAENAVPHLRDGCAKHVTWADKVGVQTDIAIVFIHGFSASCGELRPLPETIAKALGANLFATRLMGHGQDGAAMGDATLTGWSADVQEAFAIGRSLGERVLIMGCSTGCTLTALGLTNGDIPEGQELLGVCFVSPNFGLRHKVAQFVLDLPFSEYWAPYLIGKERKFDVVSDQHAQFWTPRYPTKAAKPMGNALRAARRADFSKVMTPLFMAVNADDQVIDPARARKVQLAWGGPAFEFALVQTPQDDAMGHVMAGDVFSPNQTAPLAAQIVKWVQKL
ncbi:MAG: esterase/lipase [bacterium]|jgi:esterase/lipase